MALTNCYECGAAISESANICPRCSAHYPHGVVCSICGERMKKRDSVGDLMDEMHSQCGKRVFGGKGQCRECGRTIWGRWHDTWGAHFRSGKNLSCSKCGASDALIYLGYCAICRLPIYRHLDHAATEAGPLRHRYCVERRGTVS